MTHLRKDTFFVFGIVVQVASITTDRLINNYGFAKVYLVKLAKFSFHGTIYIIEYFQYFKYFFHQKRAEK